MAPNLLEECEIREALNETNMDSVVDNSTPTKIDLQLKFKNISSELSYYIVNRLSPRHQFNLLDKFAAKNQDDWKKLCYCCDCCSQCQPSITINGEIMTIASS